MGAYLSTPVCVKDSEDGSHGKLKFGASSMQGWRISQEDAHCCLLDFDKDKDAAMFAVFDGHGGSDVAQYTAQHLPQFIRSLEAYKSGRLEVALEEAFLGFDATLVQPEVVKVLKELANCGNEDEEEGEEEDAATLGEETEMPLESLLERYGGAVSVGGIPGNKALLALRKKKEKFQSPALRSKLESKTSSENDEDSDDEEIASEKTKMKLEAALSNGCDKEDNSESVSDSTKDVAQISTDDDANVDFKDTMSVHSDKSDSSSNKLEGVAKSEKDLCSIANGKSLDSELRTVDIKLDSESDIVSATESKKDDSESNAESCDLDLSHISNASDAVLNNSSEEANSETNTNSEANGSRGNENSKAIAQRLAACRLKKIEIEAEMEKLEEVADQLEERSAQLEKSIEEASSMREETEGKNDTESKRETDNSVTEMKKEYAEIQTKVSEINDKMFALENRRLESRRQVVSLKKLRMKSILEERVAKREAEGRVEGEESDGDDDEGDVEADMSDDDDDDDDEEEGEEEDDECNTMMGGGDEPGQDSGCTAVVALLFGSLLHVANAGDSRCVLSRAGHAVDMSVDHKPEDTIETERIHKAGGRVTCDGRVNGGLNLSRAIGDHCYKQNKTLSAREQMITSLPDIKSVTIGQEDEFMVIACDGIWNVMTSQEVVDFVRVRLSTDKNYKLSKICEEMFDVCIAPDTSGDGTGCDNMTCVIVTFNDPPNICQGAPPTAPSPQPTAKITSETPGVVGQKRKAEDDLGVDSNAAATSKKIKEDDELTVAETENS